MLVNVAMSVAQVVTVPLCLVGWCWSVGWASTTGIEWNQGMELGVQTIVLSPAGSVERKAGLDGLARLANLEGLAQMAGVCWPAWLG